MAEVLVLAEHAGGNVKKVTLELLTIARQFGQAAAVWTGPGAADGQARLAEYGAQRVFVADGSDFTDYVAAPEADCWRRWYRTDPRRQCYWPPRDTTRNSRAGSPSRRTPG